MGLMCLLVEHLLQCRSCLCLHPGSGLEVHNDSPLGSCKEFRFRHQSLRRRGFESHHCQSEIFMLYVWVLRLNAQDCQFDRSYVRTRVVILKTCRRRWMIGINGERRSGISAQAARHDDDDTTKYYIHKPEQILSEEM